MSGGKPQNGGQGFGGGEQGEMLEGSLTDGGSLPGDDGDEDRGFGAGRGAKPGPTTPNGEGDAAPGREPSGYGGTPQR